MSVSNNRVDFHIHTNGSDGELSLEEVLSLACENALKLVCISDHNRFTVTEPFVFGGMRVLPACEFSCAYVDAASGEKKEAHLIGIFPRGLSICKKEKMEANYADLARRHRAYMDQVIATLQGIGLEITYADVAAHVDDGFIGRCQVAAELVRKGYAKDCEEALDRFVGDRSPYLVKALDYLAYPSLERMIDLILENDGTPVLCHPLYLNWERQACEALIADYAKFLGERKATGWMEVYYEAYFEQPEDIAYLERQCEKYGLIPSCASDFHRATQHFARENASHDAAYYEEILGLR